MSMPQDAPTTEPLRKRRRPLRIVGWLLLVLLLLLVLGVGGLTLWARTDGSLATALRLAGEHLPLSARNASGALLGSGRVENLVWDRDGLRVEVDNAVLDWRPRELFQRRLHVLRLSAQRIVVSNQGPPREDKPPSSGLPDSLALPLGLRVDVDDVRAGEIVLQGPPDRKLSDVHATYHYDGDAHALELLSGHYQDDAYEAALRARARVGARAPMLVSAQVSGAASARLPNAEAPVLAALQMQANGPLNDLHARLRLQGAPAGVGRALQLPPLPAGDTDLQTEDSLAWPAAGDTPPLRLDAQARLTPNDALPLAEASAELYALDLSTFLPDAPRTDLAVQVNVTPVAASGPGGDMGLQLRARVVNDAAGPWDARQLPVDGLSASASWQNGVATVERLLIDLAGGSVETTGQWRGSGSDAGRWQVNSRIAGVNPALLHGQLAAFPLDGTFTAEGVNADLDFDLALDAAETEASDRIERDAVAAGNGAALAEPLRPLALRQLRAHGRFAGGLLALQNMHVQTDDASLDGQASIHLADPAQLSVDSDMALDAPGLTLSVKTTGLAADHGAGQAALDLSDAAATLRWARKLPGADYALAGAQASGNGTLEATWDGGWLAPALQARLDVPELDVKPPSKDGKADTVQVRALDTTVSGSLEQAQVALRGRVLQPAHGVAMDLALDAQGGWSDRILTLDSLQLNAGDASASGHARLDLSDAFNASADLQLKAPGLAGAIKGTLAPEAGDGSVQLDLSDAAATLRWARTLPGAAGALAGARADGAARLDARWQGGLDNPRLDATLAVPSLNYFGSDAADSLSMRELQAKLAGDLSQATFTVNGYIAQGARQVTLQLAADGGRSRQDAAIWRLRLSRLAAQLQAPELGDGQWRIASANPVPITWNPAQGGQLDVAAGELTITAPAPGDPSRIIWEPVRLRDGQLRSTGRITELPMAWAQRIAGEQLENAGVSGDVVFGGQWDIEMGRSLKLEARLERVRGDIRINANPDGSEAGTVRAGLRQARIEVGNQGDAVHVNVKWDSERAGTIDGQLATRLTSTQVGNGKPRWGWSDQAPLRGHLKADLPEISVWSLLAPPGWRLHGSLGADVQISGSAAAPQVTGTLAADDLALRSVVDGLQFEDGRLRAHLQDARLIIDEFILHGPGEDGSGGSIRVTGEAGLIDGQPGAQVHAVVDKLHASVRDDRDLVASGSVDAGLHGQTVSARGTITVDRAHIILPDESRPSLSSDVFIHGLNEADHAALEGAKEPSPDGDAADASAQARAGAKSSPLRADIDIKIDLGEDFQVDGMGIDTRLAGTLELTANGPLAEMPTIKGRVETVGGTFHAYGQQLDIERGRVFFTGDVSNPGLDILALRPNYTSDQQVGALVQGTALLPQVKLYSRPTLPDEQVLAWLILGHAAPADGGEAAMMQTAALALLGGRDSQGLASSFGLDELSFGGGQSEGLSGASVTLGKRLSDRLYAAYEHSLSGTGGVLMIFYELSRRWVLRGQASQSSAVDLIYSLSYD